MFGWSGKGEMARFTVKWVCLPSTLGSRPQTVLLATLLLVLGALVVFWYYHRRAMAGDLPEYYKLRGSDITNHNYGIVIDAGSSSSKVQLFHWPPHDGRPGRLLKIKSLLDPHGTPYTMKATPGLHSYEDDPGGALESLRPLLEFAMERIPGHKHQETSLYVLSTGGMRMLSRESQQEMSRALYQSLSRDFPFYLSQDGVSVITGNDEGVFSWIAVNYLLGRLEPDHSTEEEDTVNTVGILDMGGASLQVAFEVPSGVLTNSDLHAVDNDFTSINLGCGIQDAQHHHHVFVGSYQGHGSNEARRTYHNVLLQRIKANTNSSSLQAHESPQMPTVVSLYRDPCLPSGMLDNLTLPSATGSVSGGRQSVEIRGTGTFSSCKKALAPVLWGGGEDTNAACKNCTPLSVTPGPGFKRPTHSYSSLEFYGLSEFWYTMHDVLDIGGTYSAESFRIAAEDFCSTKWNTLLHRYKNNLYPKADFHRLKYQCLKSAWMYLVLHDGLGFSVDQTRFHSARSIRGEIASWPLGAILYHTRFLPLREIQLHMQVTSALGHGYAARAHDGRARGGLFASLVESSSVLPCLLVVLVAVLLFSCGRRRYWYYPATGGGGGAGLVGGSRRYSTVSLPRNMSMGSRTGSFLSFGKTH